MITQEMIVSDVDAKYQDPKNNTVATQAYTIGLQWVEAQPVTWNALPAHMSHLEQRREARRRRKEAGDKLYNHIYDQMTGVGAVTSDGYQVVGMGFIALAILSAIISWVVQRILSHFWDQYNV